MENSPLQYVDIKKEFFLKVNNSYNISEISMNFLIFIVSYFSSCKW